MAESTEAVRIIRVRGVPEGLENLATKLDKVAQAHRAVASSSDASAIATETSAKKQLSAQRAFDALEARTDAATRAYQNFSRELNTVSRAFDTGVFGKGAEGAARFGAEIEAAKQRLQSLGSALAKGSPGLDGMLGVGRAAAPARESAAVFEAEVARLEGIAQQKAAQIGAEFGRELSDRMTPGVAKSARDAASIFTAEMDRLDQIARQQAEQAGTEFGRALNERLVSGTGKSARDAASVFAVEMDRLDDIARAKGAQAGQEFQRALNERLVNGSGKSASSSASVFQEAFAGAEKEAASVRRLRAEVDPLSEAIRANSERIEGYSEALAKGQITQTQFEMGVARSNKVFDDTKRAIDGSSVALGKYTTGAGLARHELVNLSRQAQDVFVSLASGQAPLTVLIQQGTQIADVFTTSKGSVGGFFGQLVSGAGRFAVSLAGVTTGAIATGAALAFAGAQFASGQREIERGISGIGKASGTSVEQINRIAAASATASKVSVSSAREIATAFAGTGKVGPAMYGDLIGLSRDFAAQTGASQGDAASVLAKAFADPLQGAIDLNKALGNLDAKTLDYIRTAQAQGNTAAAQKALSDSLAASVSGAADRTSGLAKAWNSVWNAASNAWDAVGKAVAGQVTLEEKLAGLIERRRNMEGGLRSRSAQGRAQIDGLDINIQQTQDAIQRREARARWESAQARGRAASIGALDVLDGLSPFEAEMRKLVDMSAKLKKGLDEAGDALSPQQAERVAEAYARVQKAIQETLPPAERQRQVNDLNVQAINARTLAERTSVEVARLQTDSAFKLLDTEQQRLQVLGKINEAQAQANREARDSLRSARDQSELSGLRPYQRRLREIEFRERDNRERFGGAASPSAALPASAAAANGLDNAFSSTLRAMAAAIPGITITSGFRTYEQQAKLYAEKPHLAAPPGRSQHEKGMAADLAFATPEARSEAHRRASEFGLAFPLKDRARNPEPWHVEPVGGRNRAAVSATGDASAATIAGLEKSTAAADAYNSIIRNANDNLAAQQRQLLAARDTMFLSNEEIAKAQKFQELYNQAVQEGGTDLANSLVPAIQKTAAGYGELTRMQEELRAAQDAWRTVGDVGKDFAGGFLRDLRAGKTAAEAFASSLERLADKILDLAMSDIGKMFNGNGGTGFFASMFRMFGGGGGSGGGAAMMSGTGGLYSSGGFTGAGGKHDPAGIVHRGEYVFSAASVGRIGLGNLDAMHRGAMKGYASGGHVGQTYSPAMPYVHPASNSNAGGNVAVSIINNGRAADVESAREVTDGNGGRRIEVVMKEQVGRALAEPGAASDTLRSNYGAKRRVASR